MNSLRFGGVCVSSQRRISASSRSESTSQVDSPESNEMAVRCVRVTDGSPAHLRGCESALLYRCGEIPHREVDMANETELRDRVRAHDSTALADFIRMYQPQLLAYIERQLGESLRSKVEPQDLLQDAAMAALHALPNTDLSDRDPFGWLCQLAQQRVIDAGRKAHAQKRAAGKELASDGSREWVSVLAASITSPSQAVVRSEQQAELEAAIFALPADLQDLLRWRYVDEMPTKEIAAKLGKSDGAVRVLLSRTVQKLQELLRSN
jgi:RNA polymerase sigma-70 factor (ECF subfamily)